MLQNRYIIVGQAGRGGMGAVYQAIDTRIGQRRVAIKEMSQAQLSETGLAQATARFQQEAAMLGSLSHPNLPRIYDAFSEQERTYLVMDYIEGKTLHLILQEAQGQPLPVEHVVDCARQLCDVLGYLHRHTPPIIFRDIKPANIMITSMGHVYLIDFGIARFFKEGQLYDTVFLGSPGYAAPEQHGLAQTNPRTDIYGLGATLYYCLTGQNPYYARDAFYFPSVCQVNPRVPHQLDRLIGRMVAHDEQARPNSIAEVQQVLATISQQAKDNTSTLSPSSSAPTSHITPASPTVPGQPVINAPATGAATPTVAVPSPGPSSMNRVDHTVPVVSQPAQQSNTAKQLPQQEHTWTIRFSLLFALLLFLSVGTSIAALYTFYALAYGGTLIGEAILALLLVLLALGTVRTVRGFLPRGILIVSTLAALLAGGALLTLGSLDMQHWASTLFPPGTYLDTCKQLLTIGIAAAALVSLGWLLHTFSWPARLLLSAFFGGTLICALAQSALVETNSLKHIYLLVALVLLIQGTLYAGRLERVRGGIISGASREAYTRSV